MKGSKSDPNFFKFPKPIEGTISVLLMTLFYFSLCDPSHVVLDYLGPVGSFARSMSKNHYSLLLLILYVSVAIHLGEAVYAAYLCRKKGISTPVTMAWTVQTFIIGFSSLLQLVGYKPDKKNK